MVVLIVLKIASSVRTELVNDKNVSIYKSLEEHPYFTSSTQHVLLGIVGWFVGWEVNGRTAAVLLVVLLPVFV